MLDGVANHQVLDLRSGSFWDRARLTAKRDLRSFRVTSDKGSRTRTSECVAFLSDPTAGELKIGATSGRRGS